MPVKTRTYRGKSQYWDERLQFWVTTGKYVPPREKRDTMGTITVRLNGVVTQVLRGKPWEVELTESYWVENFAGSVEVEFKPDFSVLSVIMGPEENKPSVLDVIMGG